MAIIIERSKHFDSEHEQEKIDFFTEIHKLDVAVYSKPDAGSTINMIKRYNANHETFIVLKDTETNAYIGYLNCFPCSEELKDKILGRDTLYEELDDEITPEQIVEYEAGKDHFLYILSVVIHPDYRYKQPKAGDTNCIRLISDAFLEFIREKEKAGFHIEGIAGCVISSGGERFARSLRFRFDHYVLDKPGVIATNPNETGFKKRIMVCDNAENILDRAAERIATVENEPIDEDEEESIRIPLNAAGEMLYTDSKFTDDRIEKEPAPSEDGGCLDQLIKQGIYVKTWKDDVYLCIPLAEHDTNKTTSVFFEENNIYDILNHKADNKSDNKEPEYDWKDYVINKNGNPRVAKRVLAKLKECIEYECENNVASDLKLLYLGCYDFLHTTDQYPACFDYDPVNDPQDWSDIKIRNRLFSYSEEEVEIGHSKGYVFLTLHPLTHMYIMCVFFPNYAYSTTQLLDQLSNNYIKIVDPRIQEKTYLAARRYRYIRLYDFLWETFRLHKCGQEKALICMSKKPNASLYPTEFQNILNAEVYNSTKIYYHIDNETSQKQSFINHAQYDYYESYMSKRVIVFLPNEYGDINKRIDTVSTISFIVELIMFQNTAMARMNKKVTQALTTDKDLTMEDVLELDREYGKTIPFWEPNNFKYLGAQAEANCVKEAFSNEELKSTYNEYQEFLEHLVDLKASERENRNSLVLNIVATVLAVIQVETYIESALSSFYESTGILIDSNYIGFSRSFNNTLFGTLVILLIIIIIKRRKARIKQREKRKL